AWEKRIQKGDIKGIQLCIGPNSDFMQKYLVKGIPRFILLDREGRIVKANAPRPSDPKTSQLFEQLLEK
ncbi:TlpA family protein disulfide reductase, partial [Prevotella sp.]